MKYLITTPCGQIQGTKGNIEGVVAYKGIRYATAARFEYPKQVTSWEGIYDATKYGNCSYQPRAFYNEEEVKEKAFYYHEFRKGEIYTYSEDCLFLNIWTPEKIEGKLPVLVYIHGGGFTGGCGHELHFDGPVWPTKGVIGVTLNYRLGPLGFMCLPELKEEAGHTGNYGLFDQLTAIKWVKNNIAAFGGDPENITIMGQSAGAMSVQQHCLSPLSDGLFNKAIMSSGGGVNVIMPTPKEEARYEFWNKVKEATGCATIEEFKKVPVDILFNIWGKLKKEIKGAGMAAAPVQDGVIVVGNGADILKNKKHQKIPYIMGSNAEDIVPPFIHGMAKKWCVAQEKPSYCYMFNHQLPGDDNGSWHSSDLWYWFGTLDHCWRPLTKEDYELSDKMTTYLTNFVKTGNPNSEGLNTWDAQTKKQTKVMHFGNGITEMQKTKTGKLWVNMFTKEAVGE